MTDPSPQKPRKTGQHIIGAILLGLIIVAIIVVATSKPEPRIPTTRSVVYEVTGTASAVSVTLSSATGSEQASNRAVPLRVTYVLPPGAFAYISAQNENGCGDVSCSISVNGQVISRNSAFGGYTIATCKGTVP